MCVIFVHVSQSLPLLCRSCTLVAAQRVIGICRLRALDVDIGVGGSDTATFAFLFTGQFTNPTIFGVLTIGLAVVS